MKDLKRNKAHTTDQRQINFNTKAGGVIHRPYRGSRQHSSRCLLTHTKHPAGRAQPSRPLLPDNIHPVGVIAIRCSAEGRFGGERSDTFRSGGTHAAMIVSANL